MNPCHGCMSAERGMWERAEKQDEVQDKGLFDRPADAPGGKE